MLFTVFFFYMPLSLPPWRELPDVDVYCGMDFSGKWHRHRAGPETGTNPPKPMWLSLRPLVMANGPCPGRGSRLPQIRRGKKMKELTNIGRVCAT